MRDRRSYVRGSCNSISLTMSYIGVAWWWIFEVHIYEFSAYSVSELGIELEYRDKVMARFYRSQLKCK